MKLSKGNKIALIIVAVFVVLKILYINHVDMIGDEYLHYLIPKHTVETGRFFMGEEIVPYKWAWYPPFYHFVFEGTLESKDWDKIYENEGVAIFKIKEDLNGHKQ